MVLPLVLNMSYLMRRPFHKSPFNYGLLVALSLMSGIFYFFFMRPRTFVILYELVIAHRLQLETLALRGWSLYI